MWLFQDNDSSTITPRYLKDLFWFRIESPYNIYRCPVVLTAFCEAITIVSVFFVLQMRPLSQNHWLILLRSSLIFYSVTATSLELECISVLSAYGAISVSWHALDMSFIWILNNVGPKIDPFGTPKEKFWSRVLTYNILRSSWKVALKPLECVLFHSIRLLNAIKRFS